jgi:hypothetical protein
LSEDAGFYTAKTFNGLRLAFPWFKRGLIGTIYFRSAYAEMDDLLRRANWAIEDGHRVRGEAVERRMRARLAAAELRGTLTRIRAERPRLLGLEMADKQGAFHEYLADSLSFYRQR